MTPPTPKEVIVFDVRGEGPMPEGSYVTEAQYIALMSAYDALAAERDAAVRDARIVYEARRDGCALVPVSHELLSSEWSREPMHLKLEKNDNGTHSMKIKMSRELSQLRAKRDAADELYGQIAQAEECKALRNMSPSLSAAMQQYHTARTAATAQGE